MDVECARDRLYKYSLKQEGLTQCELEKTS